MQNQKLEISYRVGWKDSKGWHYIRCNTYVEAMEWVKLQAEWYDNISFKRERRFKLENDL